MILLRIVLFAFTGVLGSALFAGLYQALGLVAAGADPGAVSLPTLLLEVMRLPAFALFGGVVGLLLAPFAPRADRAAAGALRWVGAALGLALLTPLAILIRQAGQLPGFSELVRDYAVDADFLAAGLGAGLLCAVTEYVYTRARARRQRALGGIHADDNDVDETLKAFWKERADSYLASRQQRGEGGDGPSRR